MDPVAQMEYSSLEKSARSSATAFSCSTLGQICQATATFSHFTHHNLLHVRGLRTIRTLISSALTSALKGEGWKDEWD
jgi:hypothetical protein